MKLKNFQKKATEIFLNLKKKVNIEEKVARLSKTNMKDVLKKLKIRIKSFFVVAGKTIKNSIFRCKEKIKEVGVKVLYDMRQLPALILDNQIHLVIIFISLLIAGFIVIINVKVVGYSVIVADDFLHYGTCKEALFLDGKSIWDSTSLFKSALNYGIWDCLYLGGRYFAMFLQIFIGPNPTKDSLHTHHIVMETIIILYFLSVLLLCYSISSNVLMEKKNKIVKSSLALLLFLAFVVLNHAFIINVEAFTWFSATLSYVVPTIMLFLSLAIFLKRKISFVLGIVLYFAIICAQGGNISVAVFNIFIITMISILLATNKRLDITHICFYIHYVIFTLISVLAPGNMYRRIAAGFEKKVNLIEGFDFARKIVMDEFDKVFFNDLIVLFLAVFAVAIVVYIMLYSDHKISLSYIMASIAMLFLPYLLAYLLSFLGSILEGFERTKMHIDMMIIINILNFLIIACYTILSIIKFIFKNSEDTVLVIAFTSLMIFSISFLYNKKHEITFNNISIVEMTEDLYNGVYDEYYAEYKKMYNAMQENMGVDRLMVKTPDWEKIGVRNLQVYVPRFMDVYSEETFFEIKEIKES